MSTKYFTLDKAASGWRFVDPNGKPFWFRVICGIARFGLRFGPFR